MVRQAHHERTPSIPIISMLMDQYMRWRRSKGTLGKSQSDWATTKKGAANRGCPLPFLNHCCVDCLRIYPGVEYVGGRAPAPRFNPFR